MSAVCTEGGHPNHFDIIYSAFGVTAQTDLARQLGARLDETGRLYVGAHQETSVDRLYAAGDVAAFPLRGDGEAIRVEHWRVAEQHGRVAAVNMLGGALAYDSVPYFWTIHFLKRLDYVGHATDWDEVVIDGDLDEPEFTAFYVKDGRVAALAAWGRDRQAAAAIGHMTDRRDWSVDELKQAVLF